MFVVCDIIALYNFSHSSVQISVFIKQIARSTKNLLFFDWDLQILAREITDAHSNYGEVNLDFETLTT